MVSPMKFSVRTEDEGVIEKLSKNIPAGATISDAPGQNRKGVSASTIEVITIIVTAAQSVGLNIIASWLYDSIKKRKNTVRINGVDFPPDLSVAKVDVEDAIRDK